MAILAQDQAWKSLLVGASLTVLGWSGAAVAQAVPESAEGIPQSIEAEAGEIVVTAQKRAVTLNDLAATANVISGDQLQKLEIKSFDSLGIVVPGYSFQRSAGGNSFVSIRGVGTTSSGQSLEQSVAAYINGVYAGGNPRELSTPLYDIGRVEVLKGGQSGIAGQNTSVGQVNIVTRQPGDDLGGYVQAGYEFHYEGRNAEGAVDLPLSEALKVRLSGFYQDTGGFIRNVFLHRDGGDDTFYSGRINAVLQASDNVQVRLFAQYDDGQRIGSTQAPFDVIPALLVPFIPDLRRKETRGATFGGRSTFGGDEGYRYDEIRGSLTIDVDLGGPTLTSVTGGSKIDDHLEVDGDQTPADGGWINQDSDYSQFHQELRLVSPSGGALEYILGGWYRHAKQDKLFTNTNDVNGAPLFKADIPFLQITDTYSVFGDLQYRLTDTLSIGGNLRYTAEKKRGRIQSISNYPFIFTAFPLSRAKLTPNFFDGSVRVKYEPTNDIMLYALYSHGTKTGSVADLVSSFQVLRPEIAETYEIGAKFQFPQQRLNLNLSAFRMDVQDFQDVYVVTVPVTHFQTENRDLYTQGVEFQADWRPVDRLNMSVSGIFMDSHDENGGRAVRTPQVTLNGTFRYEQPIANGDLTLAFFGNASYSSRYYNQPANLGPLVRATGTTPAYALVDLGLELAAERGWSVKLLVKNVTNTYVHLAALSYTGEPTSRRGFQLPLRQYFLTLGYNF